MVRMLKVKNKQKKEWLLRSLLNCRKAATEGCSAAAMCCLFINCSGQGKTILNVPETLREYTLASAIVLIIAENGNAPSSQRQKRYVSFRKMADRYQLRSDSVYDAFSSCMHHTVIAPTSWLLVCRWQCEINMLEICALLHETSL